MNKKQDHIPTRRPDRANKRVIAAHIEKDAYERFKALAEEQNTTTDAMVRAGIILLFKQSGKPAPLSLYKRLRAALKTRKPQPLGNGD